MALSQSVASELLEAFRAGEGVDLIRESVRLVMQELIETEATERVGAGRYERSESRVTDRNGSRPTVGGHAGRRCGAADPEAAARVVLPGDPGTAAADRPGPVCGGDGGLRERGVDPGGRRPRRTRWASSRASRSRRCRGSAPAWTSRSRRFAAGRCTTPRSRTCSSTPPTCTSAGSGRSPRWPSSSRPASPPTAAGRCSGWTSATPRTRCSGAGSCAPSNSAACPGSGWSSPTSTPAWSPRWAGCSKGSGTNAAGSTSPATCWPWCRSRTRTWSPRCSAPSSPNPTAEAAAPTWDTVRDQLAAGFPKIGPLMDDAKAEVLAFTAFPRSHWAKIWSTNPLGAGQPGDQTPSPRRRHLPQRGRRHPPRRRRPGRHPRRMAGLRPPLPLRGLHGQDQPDQRY